MSIYDINYNNIVGNLLPPQLRIESIKKWLYALLSPVQWLRDRFFYNYVDSGIYIYCDGITPLIVNDSGTLVRFIDNSVWETQIDNVDTSIYNPTIGQTTNVDGNTIWIKIQDDFIGINERLMYSNQKMLFEYLLNNYFKHYDGGDKIVISTLDLSHNMFEIAEEDVYSAVVAEFDVDSLFWVSDGDEENVEFNFIIYVPEQVSIDLGINYEKIISQVVDKYNYMGLIYKIEIYY